MNAFKSFVAISVFVLSAPAMAALGDTVDCAQMPAHPDCIEMPRIKADVLTLRIDDNLLRQICQDNPTLPECRRNQPRSLSVQLPPEDYERIRDLKSSYGKKFFAQVVGPLLNPATNWQEQQERIRLEQLFQSITKKADAGEVQKLIETLERVKVAVETQDQLDQRFGNGLGGVKLSLLKKSN